MDDSTREITALKRRIAFLEDTLKQFTQVIPPMDPLERAIQEISKATDSQGARIQLLGKATPTSKSLRQETQRLMKLLIDGRPCFLGSSDPANRASAELHAEAASYRNLALLANATAEALSTGR